MQFNQRIKSIFAASLLAAGTAFGMGGAQVALANPAPAPAGSSTVEEIGMDAPKAGSNYQWRNDIQAQVMAQHLGPVLHRVDGSWFNAPDIPQESRDVEATGTSLFGPGTPIFVGDRICTLAVAGYDAAGRKVGLTAGHCGGLGAAVYSADSPDVGQAGVVAQGAPDVDYSVIIFNERAVMTRSYAGVTVNAVGGTPFAGQQLCKKGVATGFTCGIAWDATN